MSINQKHLYHKEDNVIDLLSVITFITFRQQMDDDLRLGLNGERTRERERERERKRERDRER